VAQLPFDLIPHSQPPRFRWRHTVSTPAGAQSTDCEGMVLPSMETAIIALIGICKQQMLELADMRQREGKYIKQLKAVNAQVSSIKKDKA
jgi:hypothetical protein